eukprot:1010388-Karenia_brevis.AAC.2
MAVKRSAVQSTHSMHNICAVAAKTMQLRNTDFNVVSMSDDDILRIPQKHAAASSTLLDASNVTERATGMKFDALCRPTKNIRFHGVKVTDFSKNVLGLQKIVNQLQGDVDELPFWMCGLIYRGDVLKVDVVDDNGENNCTTYHVVFQSSSYSLRTRQLDVSKLKTETGEITIATLRSDGKTEQMVVRDLGSPGVCIMNVTKHNIEGI